MSKILISGYYGFNNAGDEAMLTAISAGLKALDPTVELTVLSGNPALTSSKHGVKALPRFALGSILRAMCKTDLLLAGGGSLLQDVTSTKSLFYYLSILALGKLCGKKVALYAQGIGPIRSPLARKLTAFICQKADLITVRDDGSWAELQAMGVPVQKIKITADAVFALAPADKHLGEELLRHYNLGAKPIIAFAVRTWQNSAEFTQEFAKAASVLARSYDAQIVFLPLQFPSDSELSLSIKELLQEEGISSVVLDRSFSAKEYVALVSNFQLLIGMRLHALVFSALNGVPFVAVSYDPKVDRFVKDMGETVSCKIENLTSEELVKAAAKAWQQKHTASQNKITELRAEACANLKRVLDLVQH